MAFATCVAVCSLDFTFTLAVALGAARQVSTPSLRAWLGIAIQVPPTLSSSTSEVSLGALNFSLSPLCLPFHHLGL